MLDFEPHIYRPLLAGLMCASLLLTACGSQVATSGSTSPASAPTTVSETKVSLQGTPPASAVVGSGYSFQPTASVNGTGVTFSIQGQPGWMNFNPITGAVSGTPTAGDEGQTAGITISVSDGGNSASIGPFTVSVQAPVVAAPGSATLSWTAPAYNEDGSPITGLAGYHVYYGTDPAKFGSTVDVVGAASTAYTVTNLPAGTYYFAVAAYDSNGVESAMSNVGNKTI